MPKMSDLKTVTEAKLDLSRFFGEDAHVTIRKLGKYEFTYLLNKSRRGYKMKMYYLIQGYKEETRILKGLDSAEDVEVSNAEFEAIKSGITSLELEELLAVDKEVERDYYLYSILPGGHNFTDDNGDLITLSGDVFFDSFSNLKSEDGESINDFIVNSIVAFNNKGISLGKQI